MDGSWRGWQLLYVGDTVDDAGATAAYWLSPRTEDVLQDQVVLAVQIRKAIVLGKVPVALRVVFASDLLLSMKR